MSSQNDPMRRDRPVLTVLIAALLGTAVCFRVMHLSRVPGINGDEGWWGNQALAWLANQPYEARTTSGNPIDLFFLVPVAVLHALTEHPNVSVGMGLNRAPRQDLEEAIQNGRLFLVEFAETPELAAALDWVHQRGLDVASTPVQSAGGRDFVLVLRVSAAR